MNARPRLDPDSDASRRQRLAADPRASTWLSANAGSGKTRVLTDRVARLLLSGADPQTILCLTYTKAAAAEMQDRLFRRLGAWAMRPDDALLRELGELGLPESVTETLDHARLSDARRLFAQALETPGGLKIQTIHAFCASLLRRFPLEAGVSPQFRELDDRDAALLRAAVAEEMALGPDAPLLDAFAHHAPGHAFEDLLVAIAGRRADLAAPHDEGRLRASLGLEEHHCEAWALACIETPECRALLRDLHAACLTGGPTDLKAAQALHAHHAASPYTLDTLAALERLFLYGEDTKTPFGAKAGKFPTQAVRKAHPSICDALDDLMGAVEAMREPRLALGVLRRSQALHAFARAWLGRYESAKLARGALDFDDLIARAHGLLTDPAVASWVLYRLDGGIDHVLVDEAQDTSPAQWAVIERLTAEFTAGDGPRPERSRTIFVVGDRKQSIYSFQGADAASFGRMEARFGEGLARVGQRLEARALQHSFRSAAVILRAVDATFAGEAGDGLGPEAPEHHAFRAGMPGRVDLWAPEPEPEADKAERDWTRPVDARNPEGAVPQLARRVARAVRDMIENDTLPVQDKQTGGWARRPVTPGDVLILVQRRSELFADLIRELKAAGLDVAGADRLKLRAELAVKDVEAVLRFLALPQDCLSLGAALRSPLLGWSEGDLYRLAHHRPEGQTLWEALREAPPTEARAILDDLRGRADFLRPFDLMSRLLLRHDGRRRLLARLGPEAEDGIDALLAQALLYERESVPSLTGFLEWRGGGEVEVKRQAEGAGDRIRVMTAHGAKGLEAPVVILPDCGKRGASRGAALVPFADGPLLWAPNKADSPRALRARQAEMAEADARERRRLLYVAMTRAESWLVVAAAGEVGGRASPGTRPVRAGLERAGALPHEFDGAEGLRLAEGPWDALPLQPAAARAAAASPAPEDLPPVAPPGPRTAPLLAAAPDDARARLLRLALAHLARAGAEGARDLLEATADAPGEDVGGVVAEAEALLAAPDLAALWAPEALADVALCADVPPLGRLHGTVDRLILTPEAVMAVAFAPGTAEEAPEEVLRRLGAQAAMLAAVYPGREVRAAVLWTGDACLVELPLDLVMAALHRAGPPAP
jgi:ATP-dependent helicase/nuclease subunit A